MEPPSIQRQVRAFSRQKKGSVSDWWCSEIGGSMFAITTAIDCKCLWELIGPHVIDRNAISFYLPVFFSKMWDVFPHHSRRVSVPIPFGAGDGQRTCSCRVPVVADGCFADLAGKAGGRCRSGTGPGAPIHSLAPWISWKFLYLLSHTRKTRIHFEWNRNFFLTPTPLCH